MALTFRDTKGTPLTSLEADANIRTLAGLSAGQLLPGKLNCFQRQRYAVAAGWNTILEIIGGAGCITSLWVASAGDNDQAKMRLSVDAEAVPGLFGAGGGTLAQWYGNGNGQRQVYRTPARGITTSTTTSFAGFTKMLIPFSNGFKLEYFANNASSEIWLMVEYSDAPLAAFPLNQVYRAKARVSAATLAYTNILEFTNTTVDTLLMGFYANLASTAGNNYFNEGDVRAYYNAEATPSYRSSGFEDIFDSSYYFVEGMFHDIYNGVVSNSGGNGAYLSVYKFWPLSAAPRASAGLRLNYTCGDPDYPSQAPGSTAAEFIAWTYEVNGAPGTSSTAPAPAPAPSPVWIAGQSVDDDDAGAYAFVGAWTRVLNAAYYAGAIHALAPGQAGTATLTKSIQCTTVRFASRGGPGDNYDILLDGALLQTVLVTSANNGTSLDVAIPGGAASTHQFAIRGVIAYNAYATIDRLLFL